MTNRQLVQKLVSEGYSLEDASLLVKAIETSGGGQMTYEQRETFIEEVVADEPFLQEISVVTEIEAEGYEMHTLGLAERIMRKAVEGQAPAGVTDVSISKRTLKPEEVIVAFDITKRFLKRNIARGNADQAINSAFQKQFRNDSLDLAVNGDENSGDDFINITDGWLAKAEADVNAHTAGTFGQNYSPMEVMSAMLDADNPNGLPAKWLVEEELVFVVSPAFYQKYQDELAEKNSQLGDLMTVKKQELEFRGIKLKKLRKFPSNRVMLTWKENLFYGSGQEMNVEWEYVPRKRMREYTVTAYLSFDYAISDMMVVYKQV